MPSKDNRHPLIVLLGPTGVGKTEISLELAERLSGEIVSADSRLLYRGMDIGTAKPTASQMARIPHHLIDVSDPGETWSLAHYQEAAHQAISDIHKRSRLPMVVGGTGQYLRALLEGWSPPKVAGHPAMRSALESWAGEIGKTGLHERLAVVDERAAEKIDSRNLRRTLRALEVIFMTGKKFSDQRLKTDNLFRVLQIGLLRPRDELYKRIDERIEQMLKEGWLDEVRNLLANGYSPDFPSLSALGYKELSEHLQGKLSLEEATLQIKRATRQFVRRQAAWFKPNDPNIYWVDVSSGNAVREIEAKINQFIR